MRNDRGRFGRRAERSGLILTLFGILPTVTTSVPPTIVVTGAQGFVGRRVVELLAPRAGVSGPGVFEAGAASDLPPGASPVPLDVMNPDQIAAAVRGADVVVHCAMGDARATGGDRERPRGGAAGERPPGRPPEQRGGRYGR